MATRSGAAGRHRAHICAAIVMRVVVEAAVPAEFDIHDREVEGHFVEF
jgi:hypothetical protein